MLKTLKERAIPETDLINIYKSLIRPIIEFGMAVFGPMLKQNQIRMLERFQRMSLNVIFGVNPYRENLERAGIPLMEDRIDCLFNKMGEKLVQCEATRKRLGPRVGGRELRKNPGMKLSVQRTNLSFSTPLNLVRRLNVQQTPGRTKPKTKKNSRTK
jgi:hypothetical protein